MKKVFPVVKNKYFISTAFILVYILILHDTDLFALRSKNMQVFKLEGQIEIKKNEIIDLKMALNDLDDPRKLEKYAREHHFFKKDNEDLFIFSFQ